MEDYAPLKKGISNIMDIQTILIVIGSILLCMLFAFICILRKLSSIQTRLTVIETILSMSGFPVKINKN
jgi:hypothetical protein